ncbi:hypothetical protein Fmac_005450 [Flemingia macrophylla]|uniref:Uncharacterized protein n=1 Tax=Flemingia macrophylla TaxID=520843 RepID=A0ABD1NAH8_9FABA
MGSSIHDVIRSRFFLGDLAPISQSSSNVQKSTDLPTFPHVFRTQTKEANLPTCVQQVLDHFKDVFPNEIPAGLPPKRGIKHQMDLFPGASLPYRPAY